MHSVLEVVAVVVVVVVAASPVVAAPVVTADLPVDALVAPPAPPERLKTIWPASRIHKFTHSLERSSGTQ